MLAIAVLIQGVVVAFSLPDGVKLLGDLAAVLLIAWVAVAALRGRAQIAVPYLAIGFAVLLLIGSLRGDELLRVLNSARHFLIFPALALALGGLGPSEARDRTVTLAVIGLVVISFAVTIFQGLRGLHVDHITGTFGDFAGWSAVFASLAAACLALGIVAARASKAWWVLLAAVLPLFAVWGAHRFAIIAAPAAFLVVAAVAWSALPSDLAPKARSRLRFATAGGAILGAVTLVGAFAIARPADLELVTGHEQRADYLRHSGSGDQWQAINARALAGSRVGSDDALRIASVVGAPYVGVRNDWSDPVSDDGQAYSFLVRVQTSVAGDYELFAGTYGGTVGLSETVKLAANRWTWLDLEGLRVHYGGQPFFALKKASDGYAGSELIRFDCMMLIAAETLGEVRNDDGDGCPPRWGEFAGEPGVVIPTARVPGRLTQFEAAQRLVARDPASLLLGRGLGTTTYALNLGVERPADRDAQLAGYSDFGTLLAELGWFGVALAIFCAVGLGVGCLRAARRAPIVGWTRALLIAYPGVLVAMTITATGATPFRNVAAKAIFWTLTGLVLASILHRDERTTAPRGR